MLHKTSNLFLFNGEEGNIRQPISARNPSEKLMSMVKMYQIIIIDNVIDTIERNMKHGLRKSFIVIDTNHDNSGKQYLEIKFYRPSNWLTAIGMKNNKYVRWSRSNLT